MGTVDPGMSGNQEMPPANASEYRPFDQHKWMGDLPWHPDAFGRVKDWELAHGHDVRLKCYPEYGCQAVQYQADALTVAAGDVVAAYDDYAEDGDLGQRLAAAVEKLRRLVEAEA